MGPEGTPSGLGLMECFNNTDTDPLVSATTDLVHYLFVVLGLYDNTALLAPLT
jgi:hypothetical protein